MKTFHRLVIVLTAIVLTGAGCFSFGGEEKKNDGGVFRSTNGGASWTQVVTLPGPKGVGSIGLTDAIALEYDPLDPEAIYMGTKAHGLFFSYDKATSWQQPRLPALREGMVTDIEVDPKSICTIYVAKGSRLYKTSDCGRTWDGERYVETREGVGITELVIDWYNTQVVWIGLSNGDVLKSEDGARKWQRVMNSRFGVTALLVSNTDSRQVLVGTNRGGFFRSTDSGKSWLQIEKELKDFHSADTVLALAQDGKSKSVVASTKYGLLKSSDFGLNWQPMKLITSPGQVEIKALAVDAADQNRIYYAAANTFYSTTDGGTNWATRKIPTTREAEAIVIDPKDAQVVYLGAVTVKKD